MCIYMCAHVNECLHTDLHWFSEWIFIYTSTLILLVWEGWDPHFWWGRTHTCTHIQVNTHGHKECVTHTERVCLYSCGLSMCVYSHAHVYTHTNEPTGESLKSHVSHMNESCTKYSATYILSHCTPSVRRRFPPLFLTKDCATSKHIPMCVRQTYENTMS